MALPLKAPTFVIFPEQSLYQAATDRLGALQAELAPLRNEEFAIKEILRGSPANEIEGRNYRCTLSPGKAGIATDWEQLARDYVASDVLARLLPAYQAETKAPAARVAIKARIGV